MKCIKRFSNTRRSITLLGRLSHHPRMMIKSSISQSNLPQSIFPISHDVAAHEEIGGGVHDDAGTEVFAAHIQEVGQQTIADRSGIIDGRVGEGEGQRGYQHDFGAMHTKGELPIATVHFVQKARKKAAPENFFNHRYYDCRSQKAHDQRKEIRRRVL